MHLTTVVGIFLAAAAALAAPYEPLESESGRESTALEKRNWIGDVVTGGWGRKPAKARWTPCDNAPQHASVCDLNHRLYKEYHYSFVQAPRPDFPDDMTCYTALMKQCTDATIRTNPSLHYPCPMDWDTVKYYQYRGWLQLATLEDYNARRCSRDRSQPQQS
ncbi:MAG: hypothetical protein M1826_004365 [Phylliscum demangeonii]|nr:MAG: hypothetical protein M1826_004365 [Phylliscum demangeonii]